MVKGPNNLGLSKWIRFKEIGLNELTGLDFCWT